MQRYNLFSNVHKGLRAMLYHTAGLLQQIDFIHSNDADDAMKQVLEVLDLFDRHARSEDNFVLTAIEKHQPGVRILFEAEHVEDHALCNHLRSLVNIFTHTFSLEERELVGGAIRFAFIEFLVFNLKHMAKEENILNNLLWATHSDDELHGITKQVLEHLPTTVAAQYSHWMLKGLSNKEIILWLRDVRDNAPGFVFSDLFGAASNELPAERWTVVKDALIDGVMVA